MSWVGLGHDTFTFLRVLRHPIVWFVAFGGAHEIADFSIAGCSGGWGGRGVVSEEKARDLSESFIWGNEFCWIEMKGEEASGCYEFSLAAW